MRKAVYAGSFDPITNGHLWLIEQGVELFDALVVAVGTNPDKEYTFSLEERVELVKGSLSDLPRASVESFTHRFLVRTSARSHVHTFTRAHVYIPHNSRNMR